MAKILTYEDQTPRGTFSMIQLDDGKKILISVTQTEIAIFKIGLMRAPTGTIWKQDVFEFMDVLYPQGPLSDNFNESVLKLTVEMVSECKSLAELKRTFSRY